MINIRELLKKQGTVSGLQAFQILRFAGIFITGVILAKGPITIQEIGLYERFMFVTSAVSFFWVTGVLNGLLTKIASRPEETKKIYIYNSLLLLILINILLCGTIFLSSHFFAIVSNLSEGYSFKLFLLFLLINTPTLINEYILVIQEHPAALLRYGVFTFAGFISAVVIPFYWGTGINGVLIGLIVFSSIKLMFTCQLLIRYGKFTTDLPFMKEHFMYVLPLILSFLLSGSSDYIDGFLVTSHFGSDAFAIFRYGAREFPVSLLLANALSTAMVPALSIHKTEQEGFDQLKKSSLRLMHFLFPLTIALMLSSTYLYPLIFRKEFMESAPIFNVYLLLIVSRMIFPQTVVMAKQSTGIVFKIAIIEIIVNVLASYLLMLKFGIIGVAWGTVIAYYTEKLFLSGYLYKVYGLQLGSYTPVKVWTFYTLLVFTTYLFVENFA